MPGDEGRVERLAGVVHPAGDDAHRLDGGQVAPLQLTEQAVLAQGGVLGDLLDREHRLAEADEPHDVPGDAAGQRDELVGGPLLERDAPGQVEQVGVARRGEHLQGHGDIVPCRRRAARQVASRSPDSVENRCRWPCFGAKCTVSPLAGGRRPSTRAMMS